MPARLDGLTNCLVGLGDEERDTWLETRRSAPIQRSTAELEAEWQSNWMAYREVSLMCEAMFREGFDLVGLDPEQYDAGKIKSYIEGDQQILPDGSIDTSEGIASIAWRWIEQGDKQGLTALFPILADGLDPIEPLDVRRIQRVEGWVVFDRDEITPWSSRTHLEPEHWVLSSVFFDGRAGEQLRPGQVIHRSRLKFHLGRRGLSDRERRMRNFSGLSVLELNWNSRRRAEAGCEYAGRYLDRSSWVVAEIAELDELLKSKDADGNPNGMEKVQARIRALRRYLRTLGMAVIDAGREKQVTEDGVELHARRGDKLESIAEKTGDLMPLIQVGYDDWGYGSGYAQSIAFGQTPTGIRGGANEGDWQKFEGDRNARFKRDAAPGINWMLTIDFSAKAGPTGGKVPESWTVEPRPLRTSTPMEKAEIDKLRSEADRIRIESNVVKPEEVRQQRVVNGDYESPLRVAAGGEDDASGAKPALIGIATASLDGAMAVSDGRLPPEFYALWLQSIEETRYPPIRAQAMANAAMTGNLRAVAGEPAAVASVDDKTQVSPSTVMNAGSLVAQGKMAPEFFRESLVTLDPSTFTPEVAERLTVAAQGGPEELAAAMEAEGLAAHSLAAAASTGTAPSVPVTDAGPVAQPAEKPDPFAVLADIPDDLMTPADIVQEITRRTPLPITTRHVHALAKKHGARRGSVGGVMGYSAGDIADALAKDNGLLPAEPDEDQEPPATGDADT